MKNKHAAKPQWTATDRARHKAIRAEFATCPTQDELVASGESEGPMKNGAYFAVKVVVHELKLARIAAGLTLAAMSKRTGMDQATLSRLENGRQPNPTIDTLWRYANAIGRKLVLTQTALFMSGQENGKAAKPKPRKRIATSHDREVRRKLVS